MLEAAVGRIGDPPDVAGGELIGGEEAGRIPSRRVQLDPGVERSPGAEIAHRAEVRLAELVAAVGPPAVLAHGANPGHAAGAFPVPPAEPRPFDPSERAGREVGGRPAKP